MASSGLTLDMVLLYWAMRRWRRSLPAMTALLACVVLAAAALLSEPMGEPLWTRRGTSAAGLVLLATWVGWSLVVVWLWVSALGGAIVAVVQRRQRALGPVAEAAARPGRDLVDSFYQPSLETLRAMKPELDRIVDTGAPGWLVAQWSRRRWLVSLGLATAGLELLLYGAPGVAPVLQQAVNTHGIASLGYVLLVGLWGAGLCLVFALVWVPALAAAGNALRARWEQ